MISPMLLLIACSGGEPTVAEPKNAPAEMTEEAARAKVIEALLDGRACYRKVSDYCPDDPDYLDQHIQAQLDRLFDGKMPTRARDVGELSRKVQLAYGSHQRTDEGLKLVRAEIDDYYLDPEEKTVEEKGVSVRLGVLPGTLTLAPVEGGRNRILIATDLAHDGEWKTEHVAERFESVLAAHPEEPAVRIVLQVPLEDGEFRMLDYRYRRDSKQVELRDSEKTFEGWRSKPIEDWAPYRSGEASLHSTALEACTAETYGRPLECPSDDEASADG